MPSNVGVFPFNAASPVGNVRVLIGDTDPTQIDPPLGISGSYLFFSDTEIEAILSMYGDDPRLAAARMLISIAGSQALLLKKWSSDDLSVDGAAIAEALRKLAKDLRDEVADGVAMTDIFEISYPGGSCELVPEGFPRGRYGRCSCGCTPCVCFVEFPSGGSG